MSRYLVKDKFTFDHLLQTDYTYQPSYLPYSYIDSRIQSHNAIISELFVKKTVLSIGTCSFSKEKKVTFPVTDAMRSALRKASALLIRTTAGDSHFRATFFGKDGESFSSVGTARETEDGDAFSFLNMTFQPDTLLLETDGTEVTAELSLIAVWNTLGEWGGQSAFYTAENGVLSDEGAALALTVNGHGGFVSDVLPRLDGNVYGMLMPRRNTVFMILRNPDNLPFATFSFVTDTHTEYTAENRVTVALEKGNAAVPYYFNLSACPGCDGHLTAFRLETEGNGTLYLDGYSFEQELPLYDARVRVNTCTADKETVSVSATVLDKETLSAYAGGTVALYAGTMADDECMGYRIETTVGKTCVGRTALNADGNITFTGIANRLGETTLLPYQLLLFAEKDGLAPLPLCERFYIENYRDFVTNPYAFDVPAYRVSVTDFGAVGNGIVNDTDAIQNAIDDVAAHGGGTVVLNGSADRYGKRYIVTSILLRDNTELHFENGAILWQCQRRYEYPYQPAVGHDGVIPGINWTHNLHISNLPLIQAHNSRNVKITGHGSVRMLDTGSEEGVGIPGYTFGCPSRIHCIPLGFFNCHSMEVSDIEIIRSSNYHTEFNHCEQVYIANVRLHEVKCVSGDGFGMAGGKHILVNRCFMQSNDDGIVLSCHMFDPRGILWWTNSVGADNSCRDVTTVHSYLNCGGGKGLAFITWGTNDPIQEREEVSEILAYDNVLTSVNPVGTWPDNPYNGKQPFDNSETDDYSPVKNVRIFGNRYVGNCTLGPIASTNVLTDCGVTSTDTFRNGDFSLGGMANWTMWKNSDPTSVETVIYADKEKGRISHFECGRAAAAQGLHLYAGTHTFSCELFTGKSGAEIFIAKIPPVTSGDFRAIGDMLMTKRVVCERPQTVSVTFTLDAVENDVFLGFRTAEGDTSAAGFAIFDACKLESVVDIDGINARKKAEFLEAAAETFVLNDHFDAIAENGKRYLHTRTVNGTELLPCRGTHRVFSLESAVRADDYNYENKCNGFGFRFADDGNGNYAMLFFNNCKRILTLSTVSGGKETVLYLRPDFFFTSCDFHNFRLDVGEDDVTIWVDGSLYATVPLKAKEGTVSLFFADMEASLFNPKLIK